jgi:hypothetical protein
MVIAAVVHTTGFNWDALAVQVSAIAASLVTILVLLFSLRKKVDNVHVVLNHRLDEWINQTQTTIDDLKSERDKRVDESNVQPSGKDQ